MYNILKRFLDILLSLFAMICLSPILIPVCIILLLTGEHYIFYFQKRIGYKNRPFGMYKFATMLKNSPNIGTGMMTLRNDSRVFPFGRFLRKTKINEIPQLINILKGDMSIVGPRPMVDKTFMVYPEEVREKIYDCRPGLTGIGSIVFRDEELYLSKVNDPVVFFSQVIQPFKGALELWYNDHKSLYTDMSLIFLTAWVILFPKSQLVYRMCKDLPNKDMDRAVEEFNQTNR